ncbi:MAG TPA: AMP-dependent synthetase/ligase [Polyangiaceae bacterium]|nr:AMP-dependent synthetase/ligase [Polyangiaceae bacterium]
MVSDNATRDAPRPSISSRSEPAASSGASPWLAHRSLVAAFQARALLRGEEPALQHRSADGWRALSWCAWQEQARHFASALIALGASAGDRVAILMATRVEWAIADLGSWMAGCSVAPIYAASTPQHIELILRDSGALLLLCEAAQLRKLVDARGQSLGKVRCICVEEKAESSTTQAWARESDAEGAGERAHPPLSWSDALALGRATLAQHALEIEGRSAALSPDSLATLVYTSGTNGQPKGVRVSHGALMYTSSVSLGALDITERDTQLFFLPLAHIMGRALLICAYFAGCTTVLDADLSRLPGTCRQFGVSFFCAVPRVVEKLDALAGDEPGAFRALFGERLRFLLCGAAALPRPLLERFESRGVPIYEGYGLTESSGTLTLNVPGHVRHGSVGRAIRGTEIRVNEDGEILARGPGLMQGYHAPVMPEDTGLRQREGAAWLYTGDVGKLDADGYLWLTDRKKNLFKLSTGQYVAPQLLENRVKACSKLASQVFLQGEGRAYVSALCTLDLAAASAHGLEAPEDGPLDLSRHASLRAQLVQEFRMANQALLPHERIQRLVVIHPAFALETDELTPTLKLRRGAIAFRHRALLESMYGNAGPADAYICEVERR